MNPNTFSNRVMNISGIEGPFFSKLARYRKKKTFDTCDVCMKASLRSTDSFNHTGSVTISHYPPPYFEVV